MGGKQASLSEWTGQAPPHYRPRQQSQQRSTVPRNQPRNSPPGRADLGRVSASSSQQDQSSDSEWEELQPGFMPQRNRSSPPRLSSAPSQSPNAGSGWTEVERPSASASASASASRRRRPSLSSMLRQLNPSGSLPKPNTLSKWEHLQRPSPSSSLPASSPAVSITLSSPCSSQQYQSPASSIHSAVSASSRPSPRHVSDCRCNRCQPQLYNIDGITRRMAVWTGVRCAAGCRCTACEKARMRIIKAT